MIFRSKHRNTDHLHGTCSLSPPPRQAGAAPGRRVRAGKASRSCRAHRWSCRFRALPVRGTAHPSRAPVIREATLGITANTGNPRVAASGQPDTTGRSWLTPLVHRTRTRRACARLGAPVWLRRAATGFCARRRQPAALHAQVCPEANFLAQHALCMPTPRAHYPVGCRGRGDHLCPPFFACPACALFRSPADLKGTVDIGVLCPSYSRTHHTVSWFKRPARDTCVLRTVHGPALCARIMLCQDLFCAVHKKPCGRDSTARPAHTLR